ncbi:MAG: ABC transporter six-transmembrane domain-containing protein [Thiothrix sp.]|uniref:ABC transporter six-transmembrane domain-containing protein n=1 Tax=Thiothrix sp. TaxID=1032 RepID=UPI00261EFB97|nr:ABC transporter six-transmembrane domain-containing protein [Thiothrix sp.]MDD5395396.1 ABC transporter six-transmembrane domain-containing protein [Thiothrix sp.]
MWQALKTIGNAHQKKLLMAFSLVGLENLLMLTYPMLGGFAVNAVMLGNVWQALTYAFFVLAMWLVGSARRSVDTRVFTRIYSEIVVPIIIKQRAQGQSPSKISARVALSREFVDFFETHLPTAVTSIFSIIGASLMLLILEFWSGLLSVVILLFFTLLLPSFTRISGRLYLKLNNRLERDVDVISQSSEEKLHQHYEWVAHLRVLISNREAFGYFCNGVASSILFGFTFVWMAMNGYGSAGHIYSVTTYLWMFAMSLDDVPHLVESYSNLKDVAKRVEVGDN